MDINRIGGLVTDTVTGKTSRILTVNTGVTLASGAGVCLKTNAVEYQVPTGKIFYITGYSLLEQQTANTNIGLRYATNTALSGTPINLGIMMPNCVTVAGANTKIYGVVPVAVPAEMYLGIWNYGSDPGVFKLMVFGYEVGV